MTTITDLLPRYEDYLTHERALALGTRKAYLSDLRRLQRFTTLDSVELIDRDELRAFMRHLSHENYAPATIRRTFHGFGTFWKWLRMEHVVEELATESLILPRQNKVTPHWLSEEALKRFVNTPVKSRRKSVRFRNAVAFKTLAWLGLRRGEMINLQVKDVALSDQIVVIRNTKSKQDRVLAIPDELLPGLRRLCQDKDRNAYVFGLYGSRWSLTSFNDAFKRHLQTCKMEDEDITPHTLRHTYGTLLVLRGVKLHVVKDLMGHASLKSTERYLHADPTIMKEALDRHPLRAHTNGD